MLRLNERTQPMSYPAALLAIFTLLFLITAVIVYYRARQRRMLLEQLRTMPFPDGWRQYLERTVHYPLLDEHARVHIERSVLRFVHTKAFSGVGLDVTGEMKAVIAFYACLMVRRRPEIYCYPTLQSVIVYADDFVVDELHEDGGIVSEGRSVLDGQSSHDTVVLSWPDVEAEAFHSSEYNVVIHEFAHILDFEDGLSDGFPLMPDAMSVQWEHVFAHEYRALKKALGHGRLSEKYRLIGEYAATNEAEFFAVVSERYFMQPEQLEHHFPRLFALLAAYYG